MNQVQVLMPARNCEQYISAAIQSIIDQTHMETELLVIDDGSDDATPEIIKKFADSYPSIQFVARERRGVAATLNELVQMSSAPYLARMDADDISIPKRIETQLAYLNAHDLDIVGSWVELFGAESEVWHFREHDNLCRAQSFFGRSPQLQGALLCKRAVFTSLPYEREYETVEDVRFIMQAISKFNFKMAAVREVLLRYRRYTHSVSMRHDLKNKRDYLRFKRILPEHLKSMGVALSPQHLEGFEQVAMINEVDAELFESAARGMKEFINQANKVFDDQFFEFNYRWLCFCRKNKMQTEVLQAYHDVFPNPPMCLVEEKNYMG